MRRAQAAFLRLFHRLLEVSTMRLHTLSVLASSGLAAAAALLAAPAVAHADEPTAAPAPAAAAAPKEHADDSAEADRKHFSIELNPLGIAIGRYSLQGEYLPAAHHAITLNPFYTHAPVTVTVNGKDIDAGALDGFGGELGYRFYTGSKGPNGFYIGPSVILASFSQSAPSGAAPAGSAGSDSVLSYGGAIDLGGQAVIGPGIVVGGGFGLQYTSVSEDMKDLPLLTAALVGSGVRPRILFSVGYAF
jgi:hypothetical protein